MSGQNKNSEKGKNAKKLAAEKAKRQSMFRTIGTVALVCAVIIGIVLLLVTDDGAYNIDYSKGLTDDGKIKNISVLDYIDAFDYKNLSAEASEINPTEEDIEEAIANVLDNHKTLQEDDEENTYTVKTGDEVSVEYTMYLDGAAVEGEAVEEAVDVELGSDEYEFEEGLDGAEVGGTYTIECVMPEDYSNAAVAGKTVTYEVELLGVYIVPELNDEFVAENFADYATTVDEYRTYVEENLYDANIDEFVANFLEENIKANSYPKKYLNILIDNADLDYRYMYEYYNSYYASMYGVYVWDGFYSFVESNLGYTKDEYEEQLETDMKETLEYCMGIQYIFEDMGLEMSDEVIKEALEYSDEELADAIELYGRGDVARSAMEVIVLEKLAESVTIK